MLSPLFLITRIVLLTPTKSISWKKAILIARIFGTVNKETTGISCSAAFTGTTLAKGSVESLCVGALNARGKKTCMHLLSRVRVLLIFTYDVDSTKSWEIVQKEKVTR